MAELAGNSSAVLAGARMIERAKRSVVQVRSGGRGIGAGVIWDPDGLVLTNHHVVAGGRRNVTVALHDDRAFGAEVVKSSGSLDLALLRLSGEATNLPAAPIGDSDALRVGELVYAIGHPWGSVGAVSAVGGPIRTRRGPRLESYIQTDATPYPGFSGGPLIDARGRVLGILVSSWGRGAAFAIPADVAWRTANTLSERGSLKRGYLGILSQPVLLPDGERLGLTQRGGLLVVGVEEGSPAGRGGLIVGDILATVDGQPVEDTDDLLVLLAGDRVGRALPVKLVRGGELADVEITVGERG